MVVMHGPGFEQPLST